MMSFIQTSSELAEYTRWQDSAPTRCTQRSRRKAELIFLRPLGPLANGIGVVSLYRHPPPYPRGTTISQTGLQGADTSLRTGWEGEEQGCGWVGGVQGVAEEGSTSNACLPSGATKVPPA